MCASYGILQFFSRLCCPEIDFTAKNGMKSKLYSTWSKTKIPEML